METIGAFQAKTHLSSLLDRVEKGETITITRHGDPVAMLIPVEEPKKKMTHEEIVEGFRKLRSMVKPDPEGMTIREMIDAGRRY